MFVPILFGTIGKEIRFIPEREDPYKVTSNLTKHEIYLEETFWDPFSPYCKLMHRRARGVGENRNFGTVFLKVFFLHSPWRYRTCDWDNFDLPLHALTCQFPNRW